MSLVGGQLCKAITEYIIKTVKETLFMEPDRKVVSSAESTRRELIEGTLRSWIAEPTDMI